MKNFYSAYILLLLLTAPALSQVTFDTKGRDFIVTFLPNIHNTGNNDLLYLYITADEPVSGYIDYTDKYGSTIKNSFTISDVNKIYVFTIDYLSFELEGAFSTTFLRQCETVALQKFRIVADKDVTVYGLNKAYTTSDAFLVLPTDVLGDKYFVMSYNSDGRQSDNAEDTPSQFAIVAVEDGTVVNIRPSTPTYRYSNTEQQITLNEGDVYLVQARISASLEYGDLTGTEILSNKPIAVFSGHQRSTIPYNAGSERRSRDCLAEQLYPVSTWGYNAFITPFTPGTGESNYIYKDIYRVMAARDSTSVTINGTETILLNKGKFFEKQITVPAVIESNKPILTAQFKKTANFEESDHNSGDPFMVLIPPKEQYLDRYRVINTKSNDFLGSESFTEHHISVTVPVVGLGSFLLDGKGVNQSSFKAIGNSKFAYANIRVADGIHNLSCDLPFGIIIYGYGWANSYGYIGGMGMKPFDSNPPVILSSIDCYKAEGYITDTTSNDKGIESVNIPADAMVNITADYNRIDTKHFIFKAELTDSFFDGTFVLIARDSTGLQTEKTFEIPGFTIASDSVQPYKSIVLIRDTIEMDKEICYSLRLFNYGKHPHNNVSVKSKNNLLSFKPGNVFSLNPQQYTTLEMCVFFDTFGHYTDTVIIYDECGERSVAAIDIYAGKDEVPPAITEISDSCNLNFRYNVSDSTRFDIGIKQINIISNTNCSVYYNLKNTSHTLLDVNVLNPFDDAFFKISIEDSLGNLREFEKVIPGFTVEFKTNENNYYFGTDYIGFRQCDTLQLFNYGKYKITFDEAPLEDNTIFSVPQSQFPVTVNPGKYAGLVICYNPLQSDTEIDTDRVRLSFNCLMKSLPVAGLPDELNFLGENRCGLPFHITTSEVPNTFFLESIAPNPAVSIVTVVYGIPVKSNVAISVYDAYGRKIIDIYKGISEKGLYKINADLGSLASGTYMVVLSSEKSKVAKQFIIE